MKDLPEILSFLYGELEPLCPEGVELDEDTDLVMRLDLDSTAVIDLVMELEDEFGVVIPLNALADVRTVGELARVVRRSAAEG